MRAISTLSSALPFLMLATACSDAGAKSTTVERRITVSGPANEVARFSASQETSLRQLKVSSTKALPKGESQITFTVPADYSGFDLHHAEEEALAAGLFYSLVEKRVERTKGGFYVTTS